MDCEGCVGYPYGVGAGVDHDAQCLTDSVVRAEAWHRGVLGSEFM